MRTLTRIVLLAFLCASAWAQSTADLKKELAKMEAAAKDATALVQAAEWARTKHLSADATRLLNKALKMDPNHEGANLALGFVKVDGKWLTKAKAAEVRAKALEAEYAAKGLVKVDGIWVERGEADDAKKGIFRHEGEVVSKTEKRALMAGMVRHPRTGMFIAKEDEERAQTLFPIQEDDRVNWVDEERANQFHAAKNRPWIVRTASSLVISNLPIKTIETDLKITIDSTYDLVRTLFGAKDPSAAHRPLILVAPDDEMFKQIGDGIGGAGSAYGAFLAEAPIMVRGLDGEQFPAVCNWHKDWGPYWLRHAVGLATVDAFRKTIECQELPLWFQRGVGGYCERFYLDAIAKHFGGLHIGKGGVKDLTGWFSGFAINSELGSSELDYNMFQAGLVLAMCQRTEDKELKAAWQDVVDCFGKKGSKPEKAIQKLEKVVIKKEADLRAFLQKLTAG